MAKERIPTPESLEVRVERLIADLAEQEGMTKEDIISDVIVFAPHPDNAFANPAYIEDIAEKMGISVEEMTTYALDKYNKEQEKGEEES